MLKVLFVCTGNICRSPTAEGLMRAQARERGLADRLTIDSAGTHGYHVGEPPDPRAVNMARRHGVDISGLRARKIAFADFAAFDLIIAMDRSHRAILGRLAPAEHIEKLRLFMAYIPEMAMEDVPDPYFGHGDEFEQVYDLIARGVRAILRDIERGGA